VNQMTLDLPAPDRVQPGARVRDPITSKLAAAAAKQLQADHHQRIAACLAAHGAMSKDAIAKQTGLSGVQVCRRLSEMERLGLAAPTGRTCLSLAGRQEREWGV